MSKKKLLLGVMLGGAIQFSICIAVISIIFYDPYEYESFWNPNDLSSYDPDAGFLGSELGFFKIDPETILSDLERGKTDMFMPLPEDPSRDFELDDIELSWTQADFLKIASAVGQLVWDDPMDLNNWSVYSISFRGTCRNTPTGFNFAGITYFKTTNWNAENYYETRRIVIAPHFSVVKWGSGATYPQSVGDWIGVNLADDKITADDALRIADENGGKEIRLQEDSGCLVYAESSIDINNEWLLSFITVDTSGLDLDMYIDMDTGMFEILVNDQPSFPTLVGPETSDKE